MQPGCGAEETETSSRGGEGGHCQVFQLLWAPPGDGDLLPIPGVGDIGSRRQLAGGGEELVLVKEVSEEYVVHPHQGVGGAAGVRILFQGHGTGGTSIQIGDLDGQPLHGKGPGGGFRPRW